WCTLLAEVLPGPGAHNGVRHRLKETNAVGAGRVEVEAAVIRMGEHVGGKGIFIPLPAESQMLTPDSRSRARPIMFEDPCVDAIHEGVDQGDLPDGHDCARLWHAVELDCHENGEEGGRHGPNVRVISGLASRSC